jgi:plasmid stabilization system protein ParE
MSLSILWTDEAISTFDNITEFIKDSWGETSARKFVRKTDRTLKSVSNHPYLFKPASLENVGMA